MASYGGKIDVLVKKIMDRFSDCAVFEHDAYKKTLTISPKQVSDGFDEVIALNDIFFWEEFIFPVFGLILVLKRWKAPGEQIEIVSYLKRKCNAKFID